MSDLPVKHTVTGWTWWVGNSDESYHTECQTREEAVSTAKSQGGGYIAEACKPILSLSDFFDADDFIVSADENAQENYGSENEDTIIELTAEQIVSLQTAIRAAMDKWQEENKVEFKPRQFHEVRNEAHIDEGEA